MKAIITWFNGLCDKTKHFIVGAVLGLSALPFFFIFPDYIDLVIVFNLLISSVPFIGKEIYDKFKTNATGFDIDDLAADYLGWYFGVLISMLSYLPFLF